MLVTLLFLLAARLSWAQSADASLQNIAGFDFAQLSPTAKKELLGVLKDEFDACGRPLTLLASIKKGDACKHTKRLVSWAAGAAQEGQSAAEILALLAKYQQSFSSKRVGMPKPDARMCQGAKEADAKVTVVEFSDFECPFCALAKPMLEALVKARPAVRVCYAPFPLAMHAHAVIAAQAVLFARDNGKFWPMHDALFDNQQTISEETILKLAAKVGLDAAALKKVFVQNKYLEEITAFKESGKAANLESTPTMLFNGRKLTLSPTEAVLKLSADDELDFAAHGNAWGAE